MKRITSVVDCLRVLEKYSDPKHQLSQEDIIQKMKEDFDSDICRQSIAKYIKALNENGYNISHNKRRYYYDSRLFEDSEIELLCHSVMANPSIPSKYSAELIQKLQELQSVHFAENKNLNFNICNVDKRDNRDLFWNIDNISDAIENKLIIHFHYFRYNENKKLVDFNDKEYTVVPVKILAKQNRFYMLAISPNQEFEGIRHYRIDRIKNIAKGEVYRYRIPHIDAYEYARHRTYMQGGEIERFKLEVTSRYMFDEIIDNCGMNIDINKVGEETYHVSLKAPESSVIFLAFQYIRYIKILEPLKTKEKMLKLLEESLVKYQNK